MFNKGGKAGLLTSEVQKYQEVPGSTEVCFSPLDV